MVSISRAYAGSIAPDYLHCSVVNVAIILCFFLSFQAKGCLEANLSWLDRGDGVVKGRFLKDCFGLYLLRSTLFCVRFRDSRRHFAIE